MSAATERRVLVVERDAHGVEAVDVQDLYARIDQLESRLAGMAARQILLEERLKAIDPTELVVAAEMTARDLMHWGRIFSEHLPSYAIAMSETADRLSAAIRKSRGEGVRA